jgi:hypothetical protein
MNDAQDFSHVIYDENDNEPNDIDHEPEMKMFGKKL